MWGSLPEWISALGAVGALTAAIWAALASKKLFQIESGRDELAAVRIERDQASQISAWCIALVDNDDQVIDRGLLIHNSSSTPVYDVEVDSTYAWRSTDEPKPRSMFRMGVLPPGDFITTVTSEYDGWSFPDSREIFELKVRPVTKSKAWSVTALRFTDAQGLPWGRTGRYLGRL